DPIEVKIVTFRPPSISAVMNPLIKAKGFDKKNGVNIVFDQKPGKAARAGFASGHNKVAGSGAYLNQAQYRLKGMKNKILFNVYDYYGAIITGKKSLRKITDLAGNKLAVAKFTTNYRFFVYFAKHAGLNLDDVKEQSSGIQGLMTLLMAGRVDAAQLWEPALSAVEHKAPGRFHRIEYDQAWPALTGRKVIPYIGVAAHESWIVKNKSTIRKLFAAYKDAESYLNKNPDDAARIIAEGFNLPKEVIGNVIAKGRLRIRVGWANDMADDFAAVWKAGREAGVLKGIPDSNILYRP
ncbi:MAG: ABC transporter substrate-binding protein, partial [bacterium]